MKQLSKARCVSFTFPREFCLENNTAEWYPALLSNTIFFAKIQFYALVISFLKNIYLFGYARSYL